MLVDEEKDHDEEHGIVHGGANSLEVPHRLRDLTVPLIEFSLCSEHAILIVDVSENRVRQHVPDVLYIHLRSEEIFLPGGHGLIFLIIR